MLTRKYSSALATVAAAAGLMLASQGAIAAVICNTFTVPLSIPQTADGIYINWATGQTGTSGGAVSGFDINPWFSAAQSGLNFYMGADSDPQNGAVFNAVTPMYEVLTIGTVIGASSNFSGATATAANMANWRAGVTGYLGVRFTNDNTSAVNFGWANITTTAGNGFPATINSFCFDNTGADIAAGTTPVSLQSYSVD
jgi:hypothetical protein